MKSILEKAIVHLLNGDQNMAETLFHKFMVERARQIHESLRQGEVELSENWDSEIREEEFFGDEDLEDEEGEGEEGNEFAPKADADADAADADMDAVDADADAVDADMDADAVDADMDVDADADMDMAPEEGGLGEKIDNLESKIDELTSEFDRMMAELEGEHHSEIDDLGDEDGLGDEGLGDEGLGDEGDEGLSDMSGETDLGSEMGDEGSEMGGEDTGEIADRMEDDFGDDTQPEHKMAEDFSMQEDDDMMEDITESIIAELDKISAPSNTEGKEIGSGGKTISGNRKDSLPHHPVEQRYQQAKPVLIKAEGDAHNDSFERETPPTSKKVKSRRNNDAGVKHLQRVPPKGDPKAALNHDYVNRPTTKSPVDGKASK